MAPARLVRGAVAAVGLRGISEGLSRLCCTLEVLSYVRSFASTNVNPLCSGSVGAEGAASVCARSRVRAGWTAFEPLGLRTGGLHLSGLRR